MSAAPPPTLTRVTVETAEPIWSSSYDLGKALAEISLAREAKRDELRRRRETR